MSSTNDPQNDGSDDGLADGGSSAPQSANRGYRKLIVVTALLAIAGTAWWFSGGDIGRAINNLAEREAEILAFQQQRPWVVILIAYTAYTLVTGISLPGAAPMTLCYGWFFARAYESQLHGLLVALVVISFASTSGATLAFLLSRYLFRDTLQRRFGEQLIKFNAALEQEGVFYLFSLRLIPVVPFWVINLVMGLTPMRAATFWWVSQVGMLPGTIVYVYAGTELTGLNQLFQEDGFQVPWGLLWAFALLGTFPLIVKKLMNRFRSTTEKNGADAS